MRATIQAVGLLVSVMSAGQAWAAKVTPISAEVPAKISSGESSGMTPSESAERTGDRKVDERRERLLQELRELYKQGRPGN